MAPVCKEFAKFRKTQKRLQPFHNIKCYVICMRPIERVSLYNLIAHYKLLIIEKLLCAWADPVIAISINMMLSASECHLADYHRRCTQAGMGKYSCCYASINDISCSTLCSVQLSQKEELNWEDVQRTVTKMIPS